MLFDCRGGNCCGIEILLAVPKWILQEGILCFEENLLVLADIGQYVYWLTIITHGASVKNFRLIIFRKSLW